MFKVTHSFLIVALGKKSKPVITNQTLILYTFPNLVKLSFNNFNNINIYKVIQFLQYLKYL